MNELTRILIVSASPWNKESTTAEEEMSAIQNIFPASPNAAYLVDYKSAAKVEDVHIRLIEFKPHILHFCGHGEEYGLYFLDDKGNAALVETEVLIDLITKSSPTKIQCVILNACHTEKIAELLVQQIEYVIGMKGAINGMAAVNFAKGFYTAIKNGLKIPDAFNNGHLSMRLANIVNNTGVPQLKTSHLAKPFLTDYPVDVLIHTVEGNRDRAEFFASNLENALQRKRKTKVKKLFISYSKHDNDYKDTLLKHLTGLRGKLVTWHDGDIRAGEEWDERIKKELNTADIVLYLVSHHSMASDYIQKVELPLIEQRCQNKKCKLIPVIVDFCRWQKLDFAKYNVLPEKGIPVTKKKHWDNENEAWLKVVEGIELIVGLPT